MNLNGFENVRYTFTNKLVFPLIMQDPEKCRTFLERLFPDRKISDLRIKNKESLPDRATPERTIEASLSSHGIRLDVLFEGSDAWYDIEMQVESQKDLPKRSRYYHSLMDQAFLKRSESYDTLNPQYVIFICAFDPFGRGAAVYEFEMASPETGLKLKDESYTILLNTKAEIDSIPDKLKSFYNYIDKQVIDSSDDFIKDIHGEVVELNDDTKWRGAIMTIGDWLDEKYRDGLAKGKADGLVEGEAKGKAEGIVEGKTEVAKNLKNAGVPIDTIAKATGLSKEEIEKL